MEGESSGYEAKLIAMSGLHAELLELNEQLQSENMSKERTIHHLRNEINVLRGPLPGEGLKICHNPAENSCSVIL